MNLSRLSKSIQIIDHTLEAKFNRLFYLLGYTFLKIFFIEGKTILNKLH